jgi:ferredoxin
VAVTVSSACTACGVCLSTCPAKALAAAPGRPHVDADACTDCLECLEVCPTAAISLARETGAA